MKSPYLIDFCKFTDCISLTYIIQNKPEKPNDVEVHVCMTGDIKHSKEQTHATHCRTTSINYYALEAQKLGPSEGFHKRLLTLNREEIDAGNMIKCCNPIAIRKNISQQNMCQRLDKNLFLEIWLVTEILLFKW